MSSLTLVLVSLAAILAAGLLGLWHLLQGRAQVATLADRSAAEPLPRVGRRLADELDRRLERSARVDRLRQRLEAAGLGLRVSAALGIALATWSAGFLAASLLTPTWFAALVGFGCVRALWAYVEHLRGKRREAFVGQLAEIARVLSNGTSAGLSVAGALELAATELDDPARSELRLTVEEMRIGASFDKAFGRLQERLPSRDLGVLITTLAIQQRTGGDIVRALRDMADTLEARKDLHREVKTLMAGSVFTAWLVAGMGFGSIVILNLIVPGVLEKMTSKPVGIAALVVAGTLYSIGFVLVRRTTQVET